MNLSIQFGFDEIPATDEKCHKCGELCIEKVYYPYIQVMDSPNPMNYPFCKYCFEELFKEKED